MAEDKFINSITGSPVSQQHNIEAANFEPKDNDFGEFLETTADIVPNSFMCGTLTAKWVTQSNCIINWVINAIRFRETNVQCYPVPDELNPCEDVMGSQWLRLSVWIVVILAVLGNIAVLLVLITNWYGLLRTTVSSLLNPFSRQEWRDCAEILDDTPCFRRFVSRHLFAVGRLYWCPFDGRVFQLRLRLAVRWVLADTLRQ